MSGPRGPAIASTLLLLIMGTAVVVPEAGHTRAHRHADVEDHSHGEANHHPSARTSGSAVQAEHPSHVHAHADLIASPGSRPWLGTNTPAHPAYVPFQGDVLLARIDRDPPEKKPPDSRANGPPPPSRSPPLT